MTVRPSQPASRRVRIIWTATRTIQVLAALCVALALMCLALAVLWQRQHETAECWRAAAQYHLHTDACSIELVRAIEGRT